MGCCWSLLFRCEILSVYKACAMPFTGGKREGMEIGSNWKMQGIGREACEPPQRGLPTICMGQSILQEVRLSLITKQYRGGLKYASHIHRIWVAYFSPPDDQRGAFKFRLVFLASQVPLCRRLSRPWPGKASQPEIGKAWRNL